MTLAEESVKAKIFGAQLAKISIPVTKSVELTLAGSESRSRLSMFSSLRIRNYRCYLGGQAVAYIGTWMQIIAQDWLVLELSNNSPMALGVAGALQFVPLVLFSLWAGLLADRLDKRRLLILVNSVNCAQVAILGLLDLTGIVQLWQ